MSLIIALSCTAASAQTRRPPEAQQFLKDQFAWGFSVGTPGLLNIVTEVYGGDVGGRVTAGALGIPVIWPGAETMGVAGYEFNLNVIAHRTATSVFDIGPIYSIMATRSGFNETAYTNRVVGLAFAFNAQGYFFQLGLDHLVRWRNEDQVVTSSATLLNAFSVEIGYVN